MIICLSCSWSAIRGWGRPASCSVSPRMRSIRRSSPQSVRIERISRRHISTTNQIQWLFLRECRHTLVISWARRRTGPWLSNGCPSVPPVGHTASPWMTSSSAQIVISPSVISLSGCSRLYIPTRQKKTKQMYSHYPPHPTVALYLGITMTTMAMQRRKDLN